MAASAAVPTAACTAQAGSRDMATEAAALSLAHRRGKCTPSVDTKLANAWLGFYVALTKSASRPTGAATQASTEAATEASWSEIVSSDEESPRDMASDSENEEVAVPSTSEPRRRTSSISWADATDEQPPDATEEEPQKKRSRRSHRRRRTRRRGRGKKGKGLQEAATVEEEGSAHIDEEDKDEPLTKCNKANAPASSTQESASQYQTAASATPAITMSNDASFGWPFREPQSDITCPVARLCAATLPASPSKPLSGAMGTLVSTNPATGSSPMHCEASARTPPRIAPQVGAPLANVMPSMSVGFGGSPLPMQTGAAPFVYTQNTQTGPTMYAFIGYGQASQPTNPSIGTTIVSPNVGAPLPPQAVVPPVSIVSSTCDTPLPPANPQFVTPCTTFVSPNVGSVCAAAASTVNLTNDALRLWLTGGLNSNGADLVRVLQAAAPAEYED